MPKKGRIDELFDIVALATQRDRVIKEIIGTFVAEVEKANKIRFDLKGSTKPSDVIKNTEDLINSNKKLTVIIQEGSKAVSDKIAVDKQQIQTDNEAKQSTDAKAESQKIVNTESDVTIQQTKEQVAAEDELLLSAIQNEIAMKKLAQAKRDLNAEFQKGNITEEEYAQGLLGIKKSEDALNASNANIITSLKAIQDSMKKTSDEGKKVVDSEEKMKKTGAADSCACVAFSAVVTNFCSLATSLVAFFRSIKVLTYCSSVMFPALNCASNSLFAAA